jgi:hypothetical protein
MKEVRKKNITKGLILFGIFVLFPFGCTFEEKVATSAESGLSSLYVEYPIFQEVFIEGYPKELIAKTFSKKDFLDDLVLIWTSYIDGEIGQGEVITTDVLSIGEHIITLTAYDENDNTGTCQIDIIKVNRPNMKKFERKAKKPTIHIDRIDRTTYVDNRDGTVLGKITNLMWLTTDDGYDRPYAEAYNYCLNLEFAGYEDWRLPMLDELEEIANISYHKLEPVLCAVFEAKNSGGYWTQTESDFSISSMPNTRYFAVVKFKWIERRNGYAGETIGGVNEFTPRYARCVRAAR